MRGPVRALGLESLLDHGLRQLEKNPEDAARAFEQIRNKLVNDHPSLATVVARSEADAWERAQEFRQAWDVWQLIADQELADGHPLGMQTPIRKMGALLRSLPERKRAELAAVQARAGWAANPDVGVSDLAQAFAGLKDSEQCTSARVSAARWLADSGVVDGNVNDVLAHEAALHEAAIHAPQEDRIAIDLSLAELKGHWGSLPDPDQIPALPLPVRLRVLARRAYAWLSAGQISASVEGYKRLAEDLPEQIFRANSPNLYADLVEIFRSLSFLVAHARQLELGDIVQDYNGLAHLLRRDSQSLAGRGYLLLSRGREFLLRSDLPDALECLRLALRSYRIGGYVAGAVECHRELALLFEKAHRPDLATQHYILAGAVTEVERLDYPGIDPSFLTLAVYGPPWQVSAALAATEAAGPTLRPESSEQLLSQTLTLTNGSPDELPQIPNVASRAVSALSGLAWSRCRDTSVRHFMDLVERITSDSHGAWNNIPGDPAVTILVALYRTGSADPTWVHEMALRCIDSPRVELQTAIQNFASDLANSSADFHSDLLSRASKGSQHAAWVLVLSGTDTSAAAPYAEGVAATLLATPLRTATDHPPLATDWCTTGVWARVLTDDYREQVLRHLLAHAANREEFLPNRGDALAGISNLSTCLPPTLRGEVFSQLFVLACGQTSIDSQTEALEQLADNHLSRLRATSSTSYFLGKALCAAAHCVANESQARQLVALVIPRLALPDPQLPTYAAEALAWLSVEYRGLFDATFLLAHPLPAIRRRAILACLSDLPPEAVWHALRPLVDDPSVLVRHELAVAVRDRGDAPAKEIAARLRADRDPRVVTLLVSPQLYHQQPPSSWSTGADDRIGPTHSGGAQQGS